MFKHLKRSTVLPAALLVYLAVMAWMGRSRFYAGDYLYYFGVIGGSLIIIALLYFSLRRKEALQRKRDEHLYGTYDQEQANELADDGDNQQQP